MCLIPKQDAFTLEVFVRDRFKGGTTEIYVVTEQLTNDPVKSSVCVCIYLIFFKVYDYLDVK